MNNDPLLFLNFVKTGIQMFENVKDSHFRGNDNPVIIPFYTISIPTEDFRNNSGSLFYNRYH